MKYKVLNESGILPAGSDVTVPVGETVELDEANEQTQRFLDGGFIEPVEEEPAADVPAEEVVADIPVADIPAEEVVVVDAPAEEVAVVDAPVEEVDGFEVEGTPTEPRLRYRGQIVIAEIERTVGEQTFRHITLGDGSQMDLTDREYSDEVRIAYPPVK